jgi:SAM-dependent methyltransferase
MCDSAVIAQFAFWVSSHPEEWMGKAVLEVGSKEVNGSVKPTVTALGNPASYMGVDIEEGKNVDEIVPIEALVEHFGADRFDVVICTEVLEHVYDWRVAVDNLKRVLKPNGTLIITTRSFGFPYHGYPYDFWRYQPDDLKAIFGDFHIQFLHYDAQSIGVWMKAKKPTLWQRRTESYPLYSMAAAKKTLKPHNLPFPRRAMLLLQVQLKQQVMKKTIDATEAENPNSPQTSPVTRKLKLVLRQARLIM